MSVCLEDYDAPYTSQVDKLDLLDFGKLGSADRVAPQQALYDSIPDINLDSLHQTRKASLECDPTREVLRAMMSGKRGKQISELVRHYVHRRSAAKLDRSLVNKHNGLLGVYYVDATLCNSLHELKALLRNTTASCVLTDHSYLVANPTLS